MLRGINVSGQKKIKMADLRGLLSELSYKNVETYIQSGNVLFDQAGATPDRLAREIEQKIRSHYGFEVPTLVKEPSDFEAVIRNNPFLQDPEKDPDRVYITFLGSLPAQDRIETLNGVDHSPEAFVLDGGNIYFYSPKGYGKAKMNNNFFEQKLKVAATTRNWKTVNKLAALAKER